MHAIRCFFAVAGLGFLLAGPSGASAQLEGGAALVLPRPQAIPFERLRATTLVADAGYAGISPGRVIPVAGRVQRESGRLGFAAAAGVLFPSHSTLRAGWIGAAGVALQLREDPQLLWHPGAAVYAGGSYRRIGVGGGAHVHDVDVPVGLNLSISGPLSGKLARAWVAPRVQLRASGDAGTGVGGGGSLGLMLLRTKGTGPQIGYRLSGDVVRIRDPRRARGATEWGVRLGILRLARAHSAD